MVKPGFPSEVSKYFLYIHIKYVRTINNVRTHVFAFPRKVSCFRAKILVVNGILSTNKLEQTVVSITVVQHCNPDM